MIRNPIPVRDRVILTASKLFYEKGFNSTGINEIIEKSEVAKASLYDHFKSKEEICLAYLQKMDDDFIQGISSFIEKRPRGKERVVAIFDFLLKFFHSKNFRGCWCLNTISEIPRDNVKINNEIRDQKNSFRKMIHKLVKENVKTKNSKTLAYQLYLLYEGAIVESHLNNNEKPIIVARKMASVFLK